MKRIAEKIDSNHYKLRFISDFDWDSEQYNEKYSKSNIKIDVVRNLDEGLVTFAKGKNHEVLHDKHDNSYLMTFKGKSALRPKRK